MSAATSYIDKMLEPVTEAFTPEVARRFADLQPTTAEAARMEQLAAKANEGQLSEREALEYKARISVGDVISILRLKARRYLQDQSA
jgi:hypothetical protein